MTGVGGAPEPEGDGWLAGLFDDAALFPPARLPVERAVEEHLAHVVAPWAGLVGPFVAGPTHLGAVAGELARRGVDRLDVALSGAVDQVADALRELPRRTAVVAVEAAGPLREALALVPGPGHAPGSRRGAEPTWFVEIALARTPREVAADLETLAATGGALVKFRTGGVTAEAFPTEAELAVGIATCAALDLPFKLTAGLHDPARHRDPATGFEHHGLLNVLLATDAALRGGSVDQVSSVLAEPDEQALAAAVRELAGPADGVPRARAVRDLFRSVGTCSIDECVTGLVRVGVLDAR